MCVLYQQQHQQKTLNHIIGKSGRQPQTNSVHMFIPFHLLTWIEFLESLISCFSVYQSLIQKTKQKIVKKIPMFPLLVLSLCWGQGTRQIQNRTNTLGFGESSASRDVWPVALQTRYRLKYPKKLRHPPKAFSCRSLSQHSSQQQ